MRNISKYLHFSIFLFISVFLLFSCSQHSLEDFRDEGEGVVRALTAELKKIRSRDDLLTHAPNLKKNFELLADIIIEASKYKEAHPESELISQDKKEQLASDQLRIELNRVLHLEGGPEVIEKVQEEALNRLELFDKTTLKMTFSGI